MYDLLFNCVPSTSFYMQFEKCNLYFPDPVCKQFFCLYDIFCTLRIHSNFSMSVSKGKYLANQDILQNKLFLKLKSCWLHGLMWNQRKYEIGQIAEWLIKDTCASTNAYVQNNGNMNSLWNYLYIRIPWLIFYKFSLLL